MKYLFGSTRRARRPLLLILVFGAFLVLIGITASAQALIVSLNASTVALNAIVAGDAAAVRAVVQDTVDIRSLEPGAKPGGREIATLERQLAALTGRDEILRVEFRRLDGSIVAASEPGLGGQSVPDGGAMATALGGESTIRLIPSAEAGQGSGTLPAPTVLEEFLPIRANGQVRAVVAIWRDAAPVLGQLERIRRDVVVITLSAAIVAAMLLYLIFRAAQARLTRQSIELVEAMGRDPLTSTLNHGALVERLAVAVEGTRETGGLLGLALVDIDNFRLLNDTHGHAAGDEALRIVADELRRRLPSGIVMGRYGPDEFLLIAAAVAVVDLEPVIIDVRSALVDRTLQFGATERLPLTISAGLCVYPQHGASVTAILATAARVLEEAKASGGDTVRAADPAADGEPDATVGAFDVLRGLVLAVDTKDRYTRRHSDDVARYGVFLAGRLGLDADFARTVHVAGVLHDVGKIGIPDPILRKPGPLTAHEYNVVKQHVALGHMIVRDVPDLDIVRAGIRHHHERWDGDGYLDRLAGEEIPLIARILAIGDAFSAMTTTRPYRKALGLREALTRLEDASGSQLDERLVRAFVEGIETAADAPLPGVEPVSQATWSARGVA